ncbi:hypothetical protein BLOT_014557 [Blomia tropicalis]|nr:hypothetical protein BLOT_014557 [Blomia tropicalis]
MTNQPKQYPLKRYSFGTICIGLILGYLILGAIVIWNNVQQSDDMEYYLINQRTTKGLYLGFIVVYIVLSIIAQLIGLLGTIRENVHTVMMYIILETIQTLIYLVVAIIHTIVFIPFTITLLVALWAAFYVYDLQIIKHNRSMVDDVILHTSYVSY